MLTVAAQMFIAAWLSTIYAARSYFFVTFSSTKDASSIDEGIAGDWQPVSEERCPLNFCHTPLKILFYAATFGRSNCDFRFPAQHLSTIELRLVSKCAE
ncbi:hypothetical protein T05_8235 [Trichinella murrelli]|uniref:Uncharacterized protein n=1 Tax=Trichinella murrelli TaxID=144512 RepID=A0A0V0UAH9_9BILA|nr:hypothetical protein T05_8235 [Trichinella murrelli]